MLTSAGFEKVGLFLKNHVHVETADVGLGICIVAMKYVV